MHGRPRLRAALPSPALRTAVVLSTTAVLLTGCSRPPEVALAPSASAAACAHPPWPATVSGHERVTSRRHAKATDDAGRGLAHRLAPVLQQPWERLGRIAVERRPRQEQPVAPRPAAEGKPRRYRVPGKPGYA